MAGTKSNIKLTVVKYTCGRAGCLLQLCGFSPQRCAVSLSPPICLHLLLGQTGRTCTCCISKTPLSLCKNTCHFYHKEKRFRSFQLRRNIYFLWVVFSHCHDLAIFNTGKTYTKEQHEPGSGVQKLTTCCGIFSVSPHGSYHRASGWNKCQVSITFISSGEKWFISNNMFLHFHSQELLSLRATYGANGLWWAERK